MLCVLSLPVTEATDGGLRTLVELMLKAAVLRCGLLIYSLAAAVGCCGCCSLGGPYVEVVLETLEIVVAGADGFFLCCALYPTLKFHNLVSKSIFPLNFSTTDAR